MKSTSTRDLAAWFPLAAMLMWIVATAPWNARVAVVGLAVLVAGAAVTRAFLPRFSTLVVRSLVVDVTILATLACALGFLGLTARLG